MNLPIPWIDHLFSRKRWVIHSLYWLAVLAVYAAFFGRRNNHYFQTFFFISLLLPVAISFTYFLNYFLLPRYLLRGRYFIFGLYFFYAMLASLFLEVLIAFATFLVMAEMKIRDMSPASLDFYFLAAALLMVVFLGGGIKLLLHWQSSREDIERLLREKVESELKLLKSQLNPHFLFNTLNNLYYLTTQKSERAPAAILQLSEILDYVMHPTGSPFVALSAELKQLDNYIALEKLRYDDRVEISQKVEGNLDHHKIPHMLLITLIENAFKHGVIPSVSSAFIHVHIQSENSFLNIRIRNSSTKQIQGNGIGLSNLRNQLRLLYPERHQLVVEPLEKTFGINLTLTHRDES